MQLDGQIIVQVTPLSHTLMLGLSLGTVAAEETCEALLLNYSAVSSGKSTILMHSLRARCIFWFCDLMRLSLGVKAALHPSSHMPA